MNSQMEMWQEYYEQCAVSRDPIVQNAKFNVAPVQFKALFRDLTRKLQLSREDLLVDVGCGNGLLATHLAPACRTVTGIDFSRAELRQGLRGHSPRNLDFVCGDAATLPLKDNSADKALMYSVTMHFERDFLRRILSELVRVCRPGGIILVGDNISKRRWDECRNTHNPMRVFCDYCKLNPEKLPFIGARVLMYYMLRKSQIVMRRLVGREPPVRERVKEPAGNACFEAEELIEMAAQEGQRGEAVGQDFRLAYPRYRYDLLIKVSK